MKDEVPDLRSRTKAFALRVIKMFSALPKTEDARVLGRQLLRSGTSDARWSHLQANAKQPTIGKTVDDAMVPIERDNPRLKGALPKDYARPRLDTARRDGAHERCIHRFVGWVKGGS